MFSKFVIFAILILIPAWIVYKFNNTKPPELPEVNLEEWWGPGERKPEDTSVRSFRIEWSKEMISDLRRRLTNHRPLTPPLEGIAHQYGFNTATLQPILGFWRDGYDFEKRLEYLNKFPQYKTKIQGLDIHFLWVKPKVPSSVPPVPLLLLHGWPGSVREFYEAVPPLTSSRAGYDFSFEVVAPSLPGFGYSEAAARPGLGPVDMAVVMRNLMRRLGHRRYVVQGGDWGSVVTSAMATLFPDEILGYHTNMPTNSDSTYYMKLILGSLLPWYLEPVFADRVYPLTQNFADRLEETGYFHLQATKPDTIGVAISDSPAG
ncbi:hypothetical protein JYU34_020198 [Plutella xylostella]|uniref:microsomal epoxide hydrolase n=1 Tax=Plutella xylostella TaxID=51655 RepID=A0ABQ7PU11_PLUXY|nr:hypothetical protein JYU34_020198 [Plutella xylostella]